MTNQTGTFAIDERLTPDLSLGQVINSALISLGDRDHFPADNALAHPRPFNFPSSRSAVVILVDGLGWHLLERRKAHAATLRAELSKAQILQAPLPSTTAAATALVCTGAEPAKTNMVGYSVLVGGKTMNLLQFGNGIDPAQWQPERSYFQVHESAIRAAVITDSRFQNSGMTRAVLRGADFYGVDPLADRFSLAARLAAEKPSLVYLYWSKIDHAGHQYGPSSAEWIEQLEAFDRELGIFLRRLPADTLVVLTADHGMVDTGKRIDIAEHPALSRGIKGIAGEGRAVQLHAEKGQQGGVVERWQEHFADDEGTIVVPKEELCAVYGAGPGLSLLGDAVVFSGGDQVIVDSRSQTAASIAQRGVHGSYSHLERDVPLFVFGS